MSNISATADFRPTASWPNLRLRADLLRRLREFFHARGFLEVETPILSADTVIDRHLDPFHTEIASSNNVGGLAAAGTAACGDVGADVPSAAKHANANLPQGVSVVVWGPPAPFWRYARPDLKVYDSRDDSRPASDFYAVILRRARMELEYYPSLAALHVVTVQGVPLAALKYIEP